jgi:streptogramin lyase
VFGPDRNLYVTASVGPTFPVVARLNVKTGDCEAFADIFAVSSPTPPTDLTFGPDGNLYVVQGGGVLRFNGETGKCIDFFVPPGSHGLENPFGLLWG